MDGYNKIKYNVQRDALILFVGINPHHGSYRRAVPFSNNKSFWYILCRAGVIKEDEHELRDDKKLREMYENRLAQTHKIGVINLIDRPTRDVSTLIKNEESRGVARLRRVVKNFRPKIICFVGKVTYQTFTGRKNESFGFKEGIGASLVYVSRFPIRGSTAVRVKEMKMLLKKARSI